MTVAIGSDHGGFALKQELMKYLEEKGHEVTDMGCFTDEACDYPDYAYIVTDAVTTEECEKGILICGTGIGMSITCNRMAGARAAVANDLYSAQMAREHNDANILCIGARVIDTDTACKIADVFLDTPFSGEDRHVKRIRKFETGYFPED